MRVHRDVRDAHLVVKVRACRSARVATVGEELALGHGRILRDSRRETTEVQVPGLPATFVGDLQEVAGAPRNPSLANNTRAGREDRGPNRDTVVDAVVLLLLARDRVKPLPELARDARELHRATKEGARQRQTAGVVPAGLGVLAAIASSSL